MCTNRVGNKLFRLGYVLLSSLMLVLLVLFKEIVSTQIPYIERERENPGGQERCTKLTLDRPRNKAVIFLECSTRRLIKSAISRGKAHEN